jgi:hypothetical protein
MKKKLPLILSLVLAATLASAASVHLKGGKNAEPTFYDDGLFLSVSGAIAGLGNGDVLITLEARGIPTATCTNQGGNQAPGQNPAEVVLTGFVPIPEGYLKNGTTPFLVKTDMPVTPVIGAPDCPNPNWTEDIVDVAFTFATITVYQPIGTAVLTVDCSIVPASSDGQIGSRFVDCRQF